VEGVAYLIRHAKAGDRSAWTQADELRPLSPAGRRQAEGIADRFASEPIARAVSSPAVRCVETIQPLADRLGLTVEKDVALMEGSGPDGAKRLVLAAATDGPIALCTHGDVIWELLSELDGAGARLTDGLPAKKGSVWVLRVVDGTIVEGTYVPPPAAT
jgi:broad specificity phosphatase PhoE